MKKILSFVLALCAITAFACQYPEVDDDHYGMSVRYIYLAGVNAVTNHMSDITMQGGSTIDPQLKYTAYNNMTVDLPLTVYVAATPRRLLGSDSQQSGANVSKNVLDSAKLTLSLQYRVLPSTTWITVKDISLTSWQVNLMATTGKPLFGAYVINPTASYGSTIMIRLYITAENTISDNPGTIPGSNVENIICPTENADPGHTIADSLPDTVSCKVPISQDGPVYSTYINNALNLSGLVVGGGNPSESITSRIGDSGWTYEQVMTVTVSGKRRPQ